MRFLIGVFLIVFGSAALDRRSDQDERRGPTAIHSASLIGSD